MQETIAKVAALPHSLRRKLAGFCMPDTTRPMLRTITLWEHVGGSDIVPYGHVVLAATDGHRAAFLSPRGERFDAVDRPYDWCARCYWTPETFTADAIGEACFDTDGVPSVIQIVPVLSRFNAAAERVVLNGRYLAEACEFIEAASLALGKLEDAEARALIETGTIAWSMARAKKLESARRNYRKQYAQHIHLRAGAEGLDPVVAHDVDHVAMVVTMPVRF